MGLHGTNYTESISMTTSLEILEKRIESLKAIRITEGNRLVLPVLISYMENLQKEFNSGENFDKLQPVEEEMIDIENHLAKLVLLPLPW
jgi:hypothetical protein